MFNNKIIKELYPGAEGLMIEPMLIHGSTDMQLKTACESGEYFGQLKKDGALYQFVKGHNGECYLFGRTISKKTGVLTEKIANVPHIQQALEKFPNNTIIIGEIYYPGGSSKNTTEIMGCLPTKAIERQSGDRGLIHYYMHDILMYDGIDFIKAEVNNWTRYCILAKLFEVYEMEKYNFLELAQSLEDNLYERVGMALDTGEEGMVIKQKTGLYEPGKRPLSNLKAKKVDFADVIIIGFETPTKYYYGKDIENWEYWILEDNFLGDSYLPVGCHINEPNVKAVTKAYYMKWINSRITIGAYDENKEVQEIGVIHSGISDEMKQDMTYCPEKYYGKVAKIQCMEKDKNAHTIRHGFFRGVRVDKDAKDCTLNSIF